MKNHRFIVTVSQAQLSVLAVKQNIFNTPPEEVLEIFLEQIGFTSADVTEEKVPA